MTEPAHILSVLTVAVPLIGAVVTWLARTPRQSDRLAQGLALLTSLCALGLAALALGHRSGPLVAGSWLMVDDRSAVLLIITGCVGLGSVLLSGIALRGGGRSWLSAAASHSWYYSALFTFWAALLLVPLAANLALAWIVIDATTATSALLVSFSGSHEALEAAWKYLILTALGLSLALLGIIVIAIAQSAIGHHGLEALSWQALHHSARALPHRTAVIGFVLLLCGLAAKIGWAPVHNWLPDAHSQAPAPVSALLSAALLPTVLLVAWRVKAALLPAVGTGTASALFIGFGVASLAVAVPFLWQLMPWKRLMAYSSLEHMGILAIGIGFGSPLAITGVIIHLLGHAFAKALGFSAALPFRRRRDARGARDQGPAVRATQGISLFLLAALPPSPLFLSELLIVLGGLQAADTALAIIVAALLALAFLGLLRTLLEEVVGEAPAHRNTVLNTDDGTSRHTVVNADEGGLRHSVNGAAVDGVQR